MIIRTQSPMLHPTRTDSLLRWSRLFFFVIGILALGYCAYAMLDARIYQAYQSWRFEQALNDLKPSAGSGESVHPSPPLPPAEEAKSVSIASPGKTGRRGAPLGRIEMSTIGLSAMIMEGTDYWTLQRAVGHLPETALPGETGNVTLTGHRDTFFRSLRHVHEGDMITLKTLDGDFQYRVESISVVPPTDVQVSQATSGRTLTLITCFPFYYVGSAPNRFIVRAREVETSPEQLPERQDPPRP